MTDAHTRHLVVWEARHDNGWTTLVEQPDGTFVAWAGPDETVDVDTLETRKSPFSECSHAWSALLKTSPLERRSCQITLPYCFDGKGGSSGFGRS